MPQYELNLRDYLRIFHKRKLVIIVTAAIVTVGSAFYLAPQPPLYKTYTTIKIEERKSVAGILTELVMYSPADTMESATRLIKGYPVLKESAMKLGLITPQSSLEDINAAVSRLEGSLETEKIGSTNMIRISASGPTAAFARDLANIAAAVFIAQNLNEKAQQVRNAREFIEEQLTSLEKRLQAAEEKRRTFSDEVRSVTLAEPMQKKLSDLEFEIVDLLQRYTEKHPRVVQLRDQIAELEKQLKGFSGQELQYSRLTREVEVNKRLYELLKEKLEEARINEAQKVPDVSVVNPAFLPSAPLTTNKNIGLLMGVLMGIVLGFTLAFVLETLDASISTMEDVEKLLKLPVLGAIPSFDDEIKKINGFIAVLKERIRPTEKSDAEERCTRLFAHFKPQSPGTEAYRNIHTNLKLDNLKKTIMVTSSGPREGKSTVVSNLALVLAQSGLKTVIVAADLRRPVVSKTFGIPKAPGLHELVVGAAVLDDVLYNVTDLMMGELSFDDIRVTPGIENISIIPPGDLPSNPAELLESRKMTQIISELRNRFDAVIFDVPPVLPVTDASILAPRLDCTIIVYEIGRTSRDALVRTKVQLESARARIAGVILNHIKPQIEATLRYPYYYRYKYRYYGKETPSGNARAAAAAREKTAASRV